MRGWLDQIEDVWLWGLFRHPVAAEWHRVLHEGAVAILGDAAHPTLPFLAQGANMALEDVAVLTAALLRAGGSDRAALVRALTAYQTARAARCAKIVATASRNARNYHLGGPLRSLAHLVLNMGGRLAPGLALSRFDWLYDYDATRGELLPLESRCSLASRLFQW